MKKIALFLAAASAAMLLASGASAKVAVKAANAVGYACCQSDNPPKGCDSNKEGVVLYDSASDCPKGMVPVAQNPVNAPVSQSTQSAPAVKGTTRAVAPAANAPMQSAPARH